MDKLTISPDVTIREAMKILDDVKAKCIPVVDVEGKLVGTLAYSDLQKSIFAGTAFNSTIEQSYNRKPIYLVEGQFTEKQKQELIVKKSIVPIICESGLFLRYVSWSDDFASNSKRKNKRLENQVIIMAGGRGSRLEPFTKVLPKPLIPIHDKTVIEHIIERFLVCGVNEFSITVNYKSSIIKAYFEDVQHDYSIQFIEENEPLGTAGSLKLLSSSIDQPFIVTNCDIIIESDYIDFYDFHQKYCYDISIIASLKEYIIPYGTCELNSAGHLKYINEKPEYHFLINTGMYILNPHVLGLIPENKKYDITDLIDDAKKEGMKVGVYPISESAYIDVGQWEEYKKAIEQL